MDFTDEELAEAGKRARAERKEQGLPASITDAATLASLADSLNESDRPLDDDTVGVEDLVAVGVVDADRSNERRKVSSSRI